MNVVVCRPDNRFLRRRYQRCPMCECTTEMVVRYELWHAPTVWCCRCGDSWSGGELHERPFRRGWRDEAVRRARQLWDLATYGEPPTLEQLEGEEAA